MDAALCYIAAGTFLLVPEIANRGLELATNLIGWNTLEALMYFALAEHHFAILTIDEQSRKRDVLTSKETSEADDRSESLTIPSEVSSLDTGCMKLMMSAFTFIANNLPPDFKLDTDAYTTRMPDRLPYSPATLRGTVLSNPNLASMKFGEFESLNERKASPESTIISAVLLALPITYLSEAFTLMKEKSVLTHKLAEDVVAEREKRRIRALHRRRTNGGSETNDSQTESDKSNPLGWGERIVVSTSGPDSEFFITRVWKGVSSPGSVRSKYTRILVPVASTVSLP